MPELSPAQRGAGPKLAAGVTLRRRYARKDAGPPCDQCGFPLVAPLADLGDTTHPTCSGDFEDMLDALNRTLTRRKVTAMTAQELPDA